MKYLDAHHVMRFLVQILITAVGTAIIAVGMTLMRKENLGMDAFTALSVGLSHHLPIGLGNIQLGDYLILLVIVLFMDYHQIGFGTLINMMVGYGVQYFTLWFGAYLVFTSFWLKLLFAVLGFLIFTVGIAVYMSAKFGVSSYDAIAPIFSKKFHMPYWSVRVIQDVLFMFLAFLASGPIGIMTIIISLCSGPFVEFWGRHLNLIQ
ncbi:membrane protein [Fructilactobacillus fructivorans]|uniref:YczE/YyaS/YitT family protein n=1 Tax=Fructilactobacillus fructivorans TaxID=1614 RepID=UPI000708F792|nr:membrane protein [Fructilactobacillus fructivorans]KRN41303.1 hypothetical protein IV51_GL000623 [Fructilactobacillus fructivorans]